MVWTLICNTGLCVRPREDVNLIISTFGAFGSSYSPTARIINHNISMEIHLKSKLRVKNFMYRLKRLRKKKMINLILNLESKS